MARQLIITCDRCKVQDDRIISGRLSIDLERDGVVIKSFPLLESFSDICDVCVEKIILRLKDSVANCV